MTFLCEDCKENVKYIETAGIYKINYTYEDGKMGSNSCMIKRKNAERMKDHKADIKLGKITIAIASINKKFTIHNDFNSIKN